MVTLPSSVRIYLATGAVDSRKSIDGLGAIVGIDLDLYGSIDLHSETATSAVDLVGLTGNVVVRLSPGGYDTYLEAARVGL